MPSFRASSPTTTAALPSRLPTPRTFIADVIARDFGDAFTWREERTLSQALTSSTTSNVHSRPGLRKPRLRSASGSRWSTIPTAA